jgi:polyisoprenoid-binding protein YceI
MLLRPLGAALMVLPLMLAAASPLKVDRSRSFVDVDVSLTVGGFTGRLENYDVEIGRDESGRIRSATFSFRFADLKTGDEQRDRDMLEWLGGRSASAQFVLGALAVTPDGQGHASGRLTMNGRAQLIEFPVVVEQFNGAYTIRGTATLRYTNWGLKVIRKALVMKVDPEVKVRFKLVAVPVEGK